MSEYIKKEDALKMIEQNRDQICIYRAVEALQPYSFPDREKGEWINAKVGKLFPSNDHRCSICGNILNFDGVNCGRGDANFCPNCGADMRGGKE